MSTDARVAAVVLIAAVVAWSTMVWLLPALRGWPSMLDVPNRRSSHARPTPRGGGIAVVVGLAAGIVAGIILTGAGPAGWLLLPVGALALLGLRDDWRDLSIGLRLTVQLLVAALAMLVLLHGRVAGVALVVDLLVGVVWMAGYTNAFNFMDGVNGISAIHSALAGGWFWLLGAHLDSRSLAVCGAALAGASLGFLPWNLPRARVFLGDVGSYALGASVAALAVVSVRAGVAPVLAVAPGAVYVLDTAVTRVRRIRAGHPWEPHREHVYQRLARLGLSHTEVAMITAAASATVAGGAALAVLMHRPVSGWTVIALACIGYLAAPAILARARRVVLVQDEVVAASPPSDSPAA